MTGSARSRGDRPDPARMVLFVLGLLGVWGFLAACVGFGVGALDVAAFIGSSGLALGLYVAGLFVGPRDGTERPGPELGRDLGTHDSCARG